MSNLANASDEDDELTEFILDYVDPEENDEESAVAVSQQARGRPRIPERWTRVFNVGTSDGESLRVFALSTDLLVAAGLPQVSSMRSRPARAPIFCPRQFVKAHE